ncbi:MAG: dihydroorotate dehydrogenase electron transfer subunit [Acutalibacteraceae bacterium]|nr:dihydroorotate dehydrogenase electron transfer subunit [Acutalibacteraceae bacterium]
MNKGIYKIISNNRLTKDIYEMKLEGDTSHITAPGQFINIQLDGFYLRRPISICDYDDKTITIIYKVVGHGTEAMAELEAGESLDILCGLGNGFDTSKCNGKAVLIGGGVGVPPMYNLCKKLIAEGKKVSVILGFNTASEIFYKSEFEQLGAKVYISTVDGSEGVKGFVTDVLKDLEYDYFFTCGPMPMFKAIEKIAATSGQYSFEERMGCGFGACMGCSCKTKYGNKRICRDGPVLEREEIIW